MNKTFNRAKLRRLADAGRLVVVEHFHYDEMTGQSTGDGLATPVHVIEGQAGYRSGYYNLHPIDFTTKTGRAYQGEDGNVTLYVHSNRNLTFRILPESAAG